MRDTQEHAPTRVTLFKGYKSAGEIFSLSMKYKNTDQPLSLSVRDTPNADQHLSLSVIDTQEHKLTLVAQCTSHINTDQHLPLSVSHQSSKTNIHGEARKSKCQHLALRVRHTQTKAKP